MDREEIRYLLGSTIYARAKAYEIMSGDWSSDVCSSDLRCLNKSFMLSSLAFLPHCRHLYPIYD